MNLDRRKFLSFLAVSPVAVQLAINEAKLFDPHRVIFDMGSNLWRPSTFEEACALHIKAIEGQMRENWTLQLPLPIYRTPIFDIPDDITT